jgi:hypothetical protein
MNETMSVVDACTITRVMVQIERQICLAFKEGRDADAYGMCRVYGALSVRQFNLSRYAGPLADPLYHPNGYQEAA